MGRNSNRIYTTSFYIFLGGTWLIFILKGHLYISFKKQRKSDFQECEVTTQDFISKITREYNANLCYFFIDTVLSCTRLVKSLHGRNYYQYYQTSGTVYLQITSLLLFSLTPFKVAFSEQSNQCQKLRLLCHDKLCNECHVVFSPSQVTDCPTGCHWILLLAMCKQGQTPWTPCLTQGG